MYTVKVRWQRHVRKAVPEGTVGPYSSLEDEHVIFIPADQVEVHGVGGTSPKMDEWNPGEYETYTSIFETDDTREVMPARLITVTKDREQRFLLVSEAWLLGPNGDTIERIAP